MSLKSKITEWWSDWNSDWDWGTTSPPGPIITTSFPSFPLPSLPSLPQIPPIPPLPSLTPLQGISLQEIQKIQKMMNKLTVPLKKRVSYYDTIEIGQYQLYELFCDLNNKDLTKTNFTRSGCLSTGENELQEVHVSITKRIKPELAEDLFHSCVLKLMINRDLILNEPLDLFDMVQLIPEGYKLPDIIGESDAKDVAKAFGAKLPDNPWPLHNGTHRAIKQVKFEKYIDDRYNISGQLTVNNANNFQGIPVRVTLIGYGK